MYYRLHSNCICVKGASRSAVYDLQKNKIHLITNSLGKIISNKIFIPQVNKMNELDKKLFHLLESENVFLKLKSKREFKSFSKINTYFNYPAEISNAILIISEKYNYSIALKELFSLGCTNYSIIFDYDISCKEFQDFLDFFNDTIVTNVQISITYNSNCRQYVKLFKQSNRMRLITFYKSPNSKIIVYERLLKHIVYTTDSFIINDSSKIKLENFVPNILLYTESLNYNAYYNKKIVIDQNGWIRPSFFESTFFGKVGDKSISLILKNSKFAKYWKVKKDNIEVCKDCEFRYSCIDERIPHKSVKSKLWKFNSKCNYDPINMNWLVN